MFKAMPQLFHSGKMGPIAIPSMLPQSPSKKVILRNLKQALLIMFILGEIG
jgi:hypothetical protein